MITRMPMLLLNIQADQLFIHKITSDTITLVKGTYRKNSVDVKKLKGWCLQKLMVDNKKLN